MTNSHQNAAGANAAALKISDLRFTYRGADGGFTLQVGSLVLAPGEQMLLSATSGGGKSTLLQLIAGLMEPDSGSIEVMGRNVHGLRGAARDRYRGAHVGMIFQTFNLLQGFTAAENVMAALMFSEVPPGEHRGRAESLLTGLGITKHNSLVEQLSVGQQQRVAVARAVACSPAIVLADEPTASLDPENAAIAIGLIQKACRDKGAALLCVSHDPAIAARFERVQKLADLAGVQSGAKPMEGAAR
ncbi:MAG: ABC transporter ATP-binding protein [Phycisphaerales bacterium]|jgi:putative ABC transport system ATP-binding protein